MFAIVRTGGKQYRVAPGDKIVVEKLAGEAGDNDRHHRRAARRRRLELKSIAGLIVGAEIIAQAKADKVTVFKKRRRHNYRRKEGHRQQHTILQDRLDRRQEGREEGRRRPEAGQGRAGQAEAAAKAAGRSRRAPRPRPRLEPAGARQGRSRRQEGRCPSPREEAARPKRRPRRRQRMLHLLRPRPRRPLPQSEVVRHGT